MSNGTQQRDDPQKDILSIHKYNMWLHIYKYAPTNIYICLSTLHTFLLETAFWKEERVGRKEKDEGGARLATHAAPRFTTLRMAGRKKKGGGPTE